MGEKTNFEIKPPNTSSEAIADLLMKRFLKLPVRQPGFEQKDWSLLIDEHRNAPLTYEMAKKERNKLVENINEVLEWMITAGKAPKDLSETQRGEIISLTIKKLARRREDISRH